MLFLEQTFSMDADLPSLHTMLLPKVPSVCLQNALSITIPHRIASDQEADFVGKEVWQWARAHRNHWCFCVPHHRKAASLREQWKSLLKPVTMPVRGQYFALLGQPFSRLYVV